MEKELFNEFCSVDRERILRIFRVTDKSVGNPRELNNVSLIFCKDDDIGDDYEGKDNYSIANKLINVEKAAIISYPFYVYKEFGGLDENSSVRLTKFKHYPDDEYAGVICATEESVRKSKLYEFNNTFKTLEKSVQQEFGDYNLFLNNEIFVFRAYFVSSNLKDDNNLILCQEEKEDYGFLGESGIAKIKRELNAVDWKRSDIENGIYDMDGRYPRASHSTSKIFDRGSYSEFSDDHGNDGLSR